jgi:hypothetical protein
VDIKAGFLSRSLIRHFSLALVASRGRAEICQLEFADRKTLTFLGSLEKVEFEGAMPPLKFSSESVKKLPHHTFAFFILNEHGDSLGVTLDPISGVYTRASPNLRLIC